MCVTCAAVLYIAGKDLHRFVYVEMVLGDMQTFTCVALCHVQRQLRFNQDTPPILTTTILPQPRRA